MKPKQRAAIPLALSSRVRMCCGQTLSRAIRQLTRHHPRHTTNLGDVPDRSRKGPQSTRKLSYTKITALLVALAPMIGEDRLARRNHRSPAPDTLAPRRSCR